MKVPILAAASGLAFSSFLIVSPVFAQNSVRGERVDANGMPTTHSTPEEQAQTAQINKEAAVEAAATDAKTDTKDAQYQAQQQQYQQQQQSVDINPEENPNHPAVLPDSPDDLPF